MYSNAGFRPIDIKGAREKVRRTIRNGNHAVEIVARLRAQQAVAMGM